MVRHSWVNSAQSGPGPESDSSSPSLLSILEGCWFESGLVKVVICFQFSVLWVGHVIFGVDMINVRIYFSSSLNVKIVFKIIIDFRI